jgi:hypothetical protein
VQAAPSPRRARAASGGRLTFGLSSIHVGVIAGPLPAPRRAAPHDQHI